MSAPLMRIAVGCVRGWTRLYTWRMPAAFRTTRRAEIESDLWECQCGADRDPRAGSAIHVLLRLLLGMPDDIGWRVERAAVSDGLTQGSIALTARVAGAALFLCAVWVIDVDASRKRLAPGWSLLSQGTTQSQSGNAAGPAFDVASIKPNVSGDLRVSIQSSPGGRFTAINAPLRALIRHAYQLQDFELSGGPKWIDAERVDIVAKAEGEPAPERMRLMLRNLLADRFTLQLHTETRDLPLYALVLARSDGKIGPDLRRSERECSQSAPLQDTLGITPRPGPPDPDATCGFFGPGPGGGAKFRGVTIAVLARFLAPPVRRPVFDRTGLTGYFDADLETTAEFGPPPPPPGVADRIDRGSLPSIFTVLQERLGLKLDAQRGPVNVWVIDRLEHPMER